MTPILDYQCVDHPIILLIFDLSCNGKLFMKRLSF